jgi:hypothetical protein
MFILYFQAINEIHINLKKIYIFFLNCEVYLSSSVRKQQSVRKNSLFRHFVRYI